MNEEISKEAGQAAQTIITYTIKAAKESINLDKESSMPLSKSQPKKKKEKESILKQIKKYKDLPNKKDKTKEKVKRKVKEKVKPSKKDMTREI